jgi:hypothetical protein
MAKVKYGSEALATPKRKRKGVHAKSKHKGAKYYAKKYRGQGR